MLTTFAHTAEEQENVVYLIAHFCAANEFFRTYFTLIMQLYYTESFIAGENILNWLKSQREAIDSPKVPDDVSEESDSESTASNKAIDPEVMKEFLNSMVQTEEYIRSCVEGADEEGEYDEEYADEEGDGDGEEDAE